MFPLKNTEAYIHANGFRSTLGKELADRDAAISELGSEIQALTNYVTDTGVKNLLPNNATTQTVNGITFTVASDGTVTVDGTATGNAICWLIGTASDIFASGSYKMSGCPSGGSTTTYCLRVYSGGNTVASDTGSGATFTNVSGAQIGIVIFSGTVMNNAVFKPMITKSDIPNSDYAHYQPYAKPNAELTQDVAGLMAKSFTKITNSEYANEILFAKSGTSKIVQVSAPKGIAANSNVEIPIPIGYASEVATATSGLASFTSDFVISGGKIRMFINNAGNLGLRSSIAIPSAIDEVLYMPYI